MATRSVVRRWVSPAIAGAILVFYFAATFTIPARPPLGFIPAAEALSWPEVRNGVILISSDGFGEGALVAEIALRERRPGSVVLRASKVLSEGRGSIAVYTALLKSPQEMQKYLVSIPVDAVVIDRTAPRWQQETDMLLETMRSHPETWRLTHEIAANGSVRNLLIFRYTGPRDPSARRDIRIRMHFLLGRDLSF